MRVLCQLTLLTLAVHLGITEGEFIGYSAKSFGGNGFISHLVLYLKVSTRELVSFNGNALPSKMCTV